MAASLVAALFVVPVRWPWRERAPRGADGLCALAVGVAYLGAHLALHRFRLPLPPSEAKHVAALAAVAAGGVAAVLALRRAGGARAGTVVALTILAAGLVWVALEPLRAHRWGASESAWRVGSLAAVAALALAAAADLERRSGRGPLLPSVCVVTCIGAALAIGESWGGGALQAASLAAVPAVAATVGFARREARPFDGALLPWTFCLYGVLLVATVFSGTPTTAALVLLGVPHAARFGGWGSGGIVAGGVIAVALAGLAFWIARVPAVAYG